MKASLMSMAAGLALVLSACGGFAPRPEVTWNRSPDAVIVRATFCCGFVPVTVVENYIPDATVWGDGRIVWTESGSGSEERRVLEGRLSDDQMRALLKRIVDEGFFGFEDEYADHSVADYASQCLQVELSGQSKRVCEYYDGAPQAFHDLYALISGGAGASGGNFVPGLGLLKAYPVDDGSISTEAPDANWSAEAFGISLADASQGVWVEGEALRLAWEAVNQKPWGGVVQQEGRVYMITLQVPGLTSLELAPP